MLNFATSLVYAANRAEGLQYGSYTLADEVSLALSFVSKSPGGGVVIDAGANKGDWSALFLAAKSNIAHLLAIEPQLVHQEARNKLSGVNFKFVIEHLAIGADI